MNTFDNFTAEYDRHTEQLRQANLANKATVLDALQAAKVTSVQVHFDGEGDSGQIEGITAYQNATVTGLPSVSLTMYQVRFGSSEVSTASQRLREAIETLCYDYLEQEHGGWENNDGAYGQFAFDVANRTIELEFNGRFSDVATSYYNF